MFIYNQKNILVKHYAGARAKIAQKPYGASLKELYFFQGKSACISLCFLFFFACVFVN